MSHTFADIIAATSAAHLQTLLDKLNPGGDAGPNGQFDQPQSIDSLARAEWTLLLRAESNVLQHGQTLWQTKGMKGNVGVTDIYALESNETLTLVEGPQSGTLVATYMANDRRFPCIYTVAIVNTDFTIADLWVAQVPWAASKMNARRLRSEGYALGMSITMAQALKIGLTRFIVRRSV